MSNVLSVCEHVTDDTSNDLSVSVSLTHGRSNYCTYVLNILYLIMFSFIEFFIYWLILSPMNSLIDSFIHLVVHLTICLYYFLYWVDGQGGAL